MAAPQEPKMKKIIALCLLALALTSVPARAQAPLPPEVVAELQKAAAICHARGQNFGYDNTALIHADVTVDGQDDYIITSAGYLCDNTTFAFDNKHGHTYHIFRALADGQYSQHTPSFRAYGLELDDRGDEITLKFKVACDSTLKKDRKGETRLKWEDGEGNFEIRARDLGCSNKKKKKEDDDSWFDLDFSADDKGAIDSPFKVQD